MKHETWVILEITSRGEEAVDQGVLEKTLLENSPFTLSDIFIPIIKYGGKPVWLMEGYIFIKSGYSASDYFELKRTHLISNVVSQIDSRTGLISKGVISSKDLQDLLKKADDLGAKFEPGDKVSIKNGDFEGFDAEIQDLYEKDNIRMYTLLITMRSVEIIISTDSMSIEGI